MNSCNYWCCVISRNLYFIPSDFSFGGSCSCSHGIYPMHTQVVIHTKTQEISSASILIFNRSLFSRILPLKSELLQPLQTQISASSTQFVFQAGSGLWLNPWFLSCVYYLLRITSFAIVELCFKKKLFSLAYWF